MSGQPEEERQRRARKMAEARYSSHWHGVEYAFVNAGLVAMWYWSGAGFPWPLFPVVFWGFGLVSR